MSILVITSYRYEEALFDSLIIYLDLCRNFVVVPIYL